MINSLGLATPGLITLQYHQMPQLFLLWAPSHISPHLELTTVTNNYVHIEIKITANSECQSFLVAHLVGWVLLNFGSCYGG